ncbi:MAG: polyphenol oxidase family protein [Gemmatimonadota bacterium]
MGLAPAVYPVPVWRSRFPWLVHGTTGRAGEFDLGLFGTVPAGEGMDRWAALRARVELPRAVHGKQVHGRRVMEHGDGPAGLFVTQGVDGHVTGERGVLLTVSVADCVPISLVDPERRRVALLHGGWRGTAAGIMAAGLERLGSPPSKLHAHLGPAICGACYEVGPEVHEALGVPIPDGNTPVDVRAVQAWQLVGAGVPPARITVSEHCTRCGEGFYSHRAGDSGRQVGILGTR